jgi:hypothetical protein
MNIPYYVLLQKPSGFWKLWSFDSHEDARGFYNAYIRDMGDDYKPCTMVVLNHDETMRRLDAIKLRENIERTELQWV